VRAPDITYRYIYPKDVAGPTFEQIGRSVTGSASATGVSASFAGIPKDKVLVLSNINCLANPGAGQDVVTMQVDMFTSAGAEFVIISQNEAGTADLTTFLNWQGELYIPGRSDGLNSLTAFCVFNAGVAANSVTMQFLGVVIPRANVSTF